MSETASSISSFDHFATVEDINYNRKVKAETDKMI